VTDSKSRHPTIQEKPIDCARIHLQISRKFLEREDYVLLCLAGHLFDTVYQDAELYKKEVSVCRRMAICVAGTVGSMSGVEEPAGDAVGAVAAGFACVGVEDVTLLTLIRSSPFSAGRISRSYSLRPIVNQYLG
jgi:hypothetical protein